MSAALCCAFARCSRPPTEVSGVLCDDHYAIFDQVVPERLEKRTAPGHHGVLDAQHLSSDELLAIAHQVERDALPLFLAAWQWCGVQSLRANMPRPA